MEERLVIRKNILDLDMQKYLQLTTTSIVITFTYLIGVFMRVTLKMYDYGQDLTTIKLYYKNRSLLFY